MVNKGMIAKLSGGLFALGLMATALAGRPAPASADPGFPNLLKSNLVLGDVRFAQDFKTVTVNFRNEAKATGSGFWVRFVQSGNSGESTTCVFQPAMAAGEQATRTLNIPLEGRAFGPHFFNIKVDDSVACGDGLPNSYTGDIAESNEFDNAHGGWYTVPLVLP